MAALQYGLSAFERARGGLPELPVINMFAEDAPTEQSGVMLQSRSGLADRSANMGSGPVQCIYRLDGVLGGDLFGVSGGSLYRNTTLVGALSGSGPYSMEGFGDLLFIATGTTLYKYDGTTLSPIVAGMAAPGKVVLGGGRAIVIDTDADTFMWSQPFSGTIGALSFAQAESRPDQIRDCVFLDDILVLFGSRTVEFWPNTGDDDLPYVPLESRVFERGVRETGCACVFNSKIAWVTDINQVCVNDTSAVISPPGMEALIAASTVCRLWTFNMEGTEFLALTIDDVTWAYSARSGRWSELQSWGKANWWARCFSDGVFGSAYDGKTLAFAASFEEMGGRLERRFRAGAQMDGGAVSINRVSLRANTGSTAYLVAPYADPAVEMRTSRDAGNTWTAYRSANLGTQGEYSKRVQWLGCGLAGAPGFMAEFRVTDPVDFRVSGAFVNEQFGGI